MIKDIVINVAERQTGEICATIVLTMHMKNTETAFQAVLTNLIMTEKISREYDHGL